MTCNDKFEAFIERPRIYVAQLHAIFRRLNAMLCHFSHFRNRIDQFSNILHNEKEGKPFSSPGYFNGIVAAGGGGAGNDSSGGENAEPGTFTSIALAQYRD